MWQERRGPPPVWSAAGEDGLCARLAGCVGRGLAPRPHPGLGDWGCFKLRPGLEDRDALRPKAFIPSWGPHKGPREAQGLKLGQGEGGPRPSCWLQPRPELCVQLLPHCLPGDGPVRSLSLSFFNKGNLPALPVHIVGRPLAPAFQSKTMCVSQGGPGCGCSSFA